MLRKLKFLMWCILVFTVFYCVAMVTNFSWEGRKVLFINGLDGFYRDIGNRGFVRDSWTRQRLHMQTSFEEMLADEEKPLMEKVHTHVDESKQNATAKHSTEELAQEKMLQEKYYKLRQSRVNPFDFKFIEAGENICNKDEKPYLIILCLTKYYDIETRVAIRDTWGSIARKKQWHGVHGELPVVKLVFLLGGHENGSVRKAVIADEKQRFGDIVAADFIDSYSNLTLKVMMGLKWVSSYCPGARFVVKIDQDTFLHVMNLLTFLHFLPVPKEGIIIGYKNVAPKVMRTGKWSIDKNSLPLTHYPNYTNGNCYVISGNVVPDLLDAAEQMPYIRVEDAFLTGIVRTVLGVKIYDHKGFTKWTDKPPRLCGFHNGVRIAATNTDDDRKRNLWKALNYVNLKNCYDILKHADH